MATLNLALVAPDRTVYEGEVASAVLPGAMGYLGILPHHAPMIVALQPGIIETELLDRTRHHFAIGGGFLEVSGESAIVLADDAELASEIDVQRAEEALASARAALHGDESSMTRDEARLEMERALNRIRAAERK